MKLQLRRHTSHPPGEHRQLLGSAAAVPTSQQVGVGCRDFQCADLHPPGTHHSCSWTRVRTCQDWEALSTVACCGGRWWGGRHCRPQCRPLAAGCQLRLPAPHLRTHKVGDEDMLAEGGVAVHQGVAAGGVHFVHLHAVRVIAEGSSSLHRGTRGRRAGVGDGCSSGGAVRHAPWPQRLPCRRQCACHCTWGHPTDAARSRPARTRRLQAIRGASQTPRQTPAACSAGCAPTCQRAGCGRHAARGLPIPCRCDCALLVTATPRCERAAAAAGGQERVHATGLVSGNARQCCRSF